MLWKSDLFAPAVVMSGLWQRIKDARVVPFAYLVASEELLQSVKKTSAYLGMECLVRIGSRRLTKMARKLCPELEPVGIKTASIPTT